LTPSALREEKFRGNSAKIEDLSESGYFSGILDIFNEREMFVIKQERFA
jgi:hypothetical protein